MDNNLGQIIGEFEVLAINDSKMTAQINMNLKTFYADEIFTVQRCPENFEELLGDDIYPCEILKSKTLKSSELDLKKPITISGTLTFEDIN